MFFDKCDSKKQKAFFSGHEWFGIPQNGFVSLPFRLYTYINTYKQTYKKNTHTNKHTYKETKKERKKERNKQTNN